MLLRRTDGTVGICLFVALMAGIRPDTRAAAAVRRQTMLIRSTDAARCAFRPETEIVSVAIVKAVHLFFDNMGYFTD